MPLRYINNMNAYERSQPKQQNEPTCAASLQNRHSILTNQIKRKNNLAEIKRLLTEISDIDLANQLMSLVAEIYMDAEYRERTNLQMREIVIKMQHQITTLRKKATQGINLPNSNQYFNFQQQLQRGERVTRELEQRNLQLLSQVASWQQESYQLRNELANSSVNNQTQMLIEQLTLQLQQQKSRAHSMCARAAYLEQQIKLCERELTEKAKKIRLLQLQANRKS